MIEHWESEEELVRKWGSWLINYEGIAGSDSSSPKAANSQVFSLEAQLLDADRLVPPTSF